MTCRSQLEPCPALGKWKATLIALGAVWDNARELYNEVWHGVPSCTHNSHEVCFCLGTDARLSIHLRTTKMESERQRWGVLSIRPHPGSSPGDAPWIN